MPPDKLQLKNTKIKDRLRRVLKVASKGDAGLLDELNTLYDRVDQIYAELLDKFGQAIQTAETTQKMEGKSGKTPSKEELLAIIQPLIPTVENGKDYILTPQDKKDIAKSIKVPIVEKQVIVEKTEVIRETPIVTEIIKKVENPANLLPLQEKIDELEKKVNEKPKEPLMSRVGWGAHPLVIQSSGTNIVKVARVLNFVGSTISQSPAGVTTITALTGTFQNKTELTTTTLDGTTVQTCNFAHTVGTIFLNGQKQILNVDYTTSGTSITFLNIFPLGYVENLY